MSISVDFIRFYLITAQRYASAVYAMALCLSVSVSVTSRCFTKTDKHRITQTKSHDSSGTLVLLLPAGAPNAGGVG